ncbi:MAG: LemA family protein [Bacteroidales bacterium]|nr:LemA family protein [Bacteroidales bacterium]
MKKSLGTGGIIIAVLVLVLIWGISAYNQLVGSEESVSKTWSQVENVYQRRLDLIPNLIKTVQGAADYEKSTLQAVIEARSKASSIQLNAENMSQEQLQAFTQAQDELGSAVSRLMLTIERYPELKANQNFLELQSQLEGTENRITVERQKYNQVVGNFNTQVRRFPKNIIASMFGFEKKAYFEASAGAEQAPAVDFNF